jgi:hypothetical protein
MTHADSIVAHIVATLFIAVIFFAAGYATRGDKE